MAEGEIASTRPAPPSAGGPVLVVRPSGPALSDSGKLRVFVSYSRDDLDFADQLVAGLGLAGFDPTIDRHAISGGEEWRLRLGGLIREADTVVFVLSPASAQSPVCAWEVDEAAGMGKRILPVVCRPLGETSPPPRLASLNYIFFHPDETSPGEGFGTGLVKLAAALNTDLDWLREHTRLLQRATEWDAARRIENRMLSGADISEAKAWAARRPKGAPEPTALHLDFIRASEAAEQARLSAEGRRLAEMAAAQEARAKALADAEAALAREAEAQQGRARARGVIAWGSAAAAIILAGVAAFANVQWRKAETQEQAAVKEKERAETALVQIEKERARADRAISAATDAARALGSDFAQGGADLKDVPRDVIKAILTRAHDIIKTLVSAGETSPERDLATSLERIADLQLADGDLAGALAKFEEALVIRERLAAGSANAQWKRDLAISLTKVADARRAQGDQVGALTNYERSRSLYETLATAEPLDAELRRGLAIALERIGSMRRDAGDRPGTLPHFERSLAIYETLAAADPLDIRFQRGQALALERIGGIRRSEGDQAGALASYERSLALYQKLAAAEPLDSRWQRGSAIAIERIAGLRLDEGDQAAARAAYEKLLPFQDKVAAATEDDEKKSIGRAGPMTARQQNGVAWVALFCQSARGFRTRTRAQFRLSHDRNEPGARAALSRSRRRGADNIRGAQKQKTDGCRRQALGASHRRGLRPIPQSGARSLDDARDRSPHETAGRPA